MAEIALIGAKFDLWPHATRKQEFSEIQHINQIEGLNWFYIHAKNKKNLMKHFGDMLKNNDFFAQNELKWGPGDEVEFFSKIRPCHFSYFISIWLHAKFQKKLMSGSLEKCVNERTDTGYF